MSRRSLATVPVLLAVVVTAYGGLLRLDAFVQMYGTVDRPSWAHLLTHDVAPLAASVRPSAYRWSADTPYVGGDPINYLKYAREMRSFYQAHVREPIFLALTRAYLWLLSDQDAAVSFASMTGSMLTIFAAYLLGAAALSRAAGLVAALILAVDYDLISWSVEGWRDDVFMAMVVLSAWAFVRIRRDPSRGHAALLGVVTAAACLTRITALAFVLPGLAWLVVDGDVSERRRRLKAASIATCVLALLVAPYLISCAIATGDPFYAIDYHTKFYRYGEGLPSEQPMSAAAYVASKIGGRPIAALDTATTGLFVHPFVTKWRGLEAWIPGIGSVLSWLAIAGLLAWPFFANGRMLLVILFGSLLPYAFTWNVRGGGEWRFTMHAFPFYVLAALSAVELARRGGTALWRDPRGVGAVLRTPRARLALTAGAVLALVCAIYAVLPWFVVREAIARGDDVSIETGSRDATFFGAGWSASYEDGRIFRVSQAERAIVRIPLPSKRTYQIVLRLDPVAPDRQRRAVVLLNRQLLATLLLTWNPDRVGTYPLQLPSDKVRVGSNELTIVPDTLVPAASAGPRFASRGPQDLLGVRLWYVRVLAPAPAAMIQQP
jgi:4-amino-4-deoxy-L-arabinose transferase-like glycosyltransferase